MDEQRVLFLCTGNSCRSQMAEGLVNHYLGEKWAACSAGTDPAGYVHPLAIQVMLEVGIDISQQRSKPVDEFQGTAFDLVVTVCGDAVENCPLWLGPGRVVHMGFPDPARFNGSHRQMLAVFRQVCNDMYEQIVGYLEGIYVDANPGA
jgi:arsenate reductase